MSERTHSIDNQLPFQEAQLPAAEVFQPIETPKDPIDQPTGLAASTAADQQIDINNSQENTNSVGIFKPQRSIVGFPKRKRL